MTSPVTPDEPESARSEDREAAPDALDVPRLADALRATGALWSANDYYEATTDADEFAAAIAREYRAEAGRAATVSASVEPTAAARSERGNREEPDLSTAWEAAEAALPEGWRLKGLELGSDWRAYAEPSPAYTRHGRREMWLGIGAHGPTKEAALAALTARLQARSTEQGGAG